MKKILGGLAALIMVGVLASIVLADVGCWGDSDAPAVRFEEPDSLNFGTVLLGEFRDLEFLIRNDGGDTLQGDVRLGEECLSFSLEEGAGSYALTASQEWRVVVRYAPSGLMGPEFCLVRTSEP